ncbi:L,D-transpeptidase family protein [Lacticaseibacillus thailandensis]|uniref:L,D-transpeptidase family protein n=1 Tax=Lacticaseibacillus thailandensis TaxID=381741 RepID=UPI0006D11ED0|nr:L,D-transpeptidase family protein [Lacticaseibacillus thailandensis]
MNSKKKLTVGIAAAVVILAGIYGGVAVHYSHRYLPHTNVLGVKISGQTEAEANRTLTKRFSALKYKLNDGKKTVATASGTDLGIRRSFTKTLSSLDQQQNQWAWLGHALGLGGTSAKVDPVINTKQLHAYTKALATKENGHRRASKDANMSFNKSGLQVSKEVYGNQFDVNKLDSTIVRAIRADKQTVQLNQTYIKPAVTTRSAQFTKAKTQLAKLAQETGRVTVENHSETITKDDLYQWLGYNHGAITVDANGVKNFVKSMGAKYDTYGKERTFNSTKRGTVKVPGGTYGWSIQQTRTADEVVKHIKAGKDFTVKAITSGSGYHADGTDIGNTYVEVDLQNQHEYYYKDGKLALDSDIVSGKPSAGDASPVGVDFVWSKQTNATLRGVGQSGENYATPVKYWMPIDYTGVGLHDAPWQPKFGGDWYLSHGSNGCINNPPSFMPKLYAAVAVGTPVIVF